MRVYYVVLVVVATLFTSANALSMTAGTKLRSHLACVDHNQVKTGRSLRVVRKSDEANELDAITSEERGVTTPTEMKLFRWQNNPSSNALAKLGVDNLHALTLKKKINPFYMETMDTREATRLWKLAIRHYSTYKFWKKEGLDKIITIRKGMTFDQIAAEIKKLQGTESFRVYKRYATGFDQHRIANFKSGYKQDAYYIDEKASAVEKYVRAQFWAEAKIDKKHVLEFLGMKGAKPEVVNRNPYYQYYLKMSNQLP